MPSCFKEGSADWSATEAPPQNNSPDSTLHITNRILDFMVPSLRFKSLSS